MSTPLSSQCAALAATLAGVVSTLETNLVNVLYTAPSASAWAASTVYALGAQIQDANGAQQRCVVAGTSGASAPAWATAMSGLTTDGTAKWMKCANAGDPGHFQSGCDSVANGSLSDAGAADSGGAWAAMFGHAIGRDDIALECMEFVYNNFLLKGLNITYSSAANTWNKAYEMTTPYDGIEEFSTYSPSDAGAPSSISQEATWEFILALLTLYEVDGLDTFFEGLNTTTDAVIQDLVTGQFNVLKATGDGSLLANSAASLAPPWKYTALPTFTPTAWMWIAGIWPSLILSTNITPPMYPVLIIPDGQNQSVDDRNGSTTVGTFRVKAIDPTGLLKQLAAEQALIGQTAKLKMGFPGLAYADFVEMHTVQIAGVAWDENGLIEIECADVQRWIEGAVIWANGGPGAYVPGD